METTLEPPEDDEGQDPPGDLEVPDEEFLSPTDAADDDTVDDQEQDDDDDLQNPAD